MNFLYMRVNVSKLNSLFLHIKINKNGKIISIHDGYFELMQAV
jgi:hypothetical protein